MKLFYITERISGGGAAGIAGVLLRGIGFLALLTGALFLLNYFGPNEHERLQKEFDDPEIIDPDKEYTPIDSLDTDDPVYRDTTWIITAPDIPELPDPDSNRITTPDPEDIVEDPDNGRRYVATLLNVILEKEDEGTLAAFARRFKQVYPGAEYRITFADQLTYLLQIAVPAEARERVKKEMPGRLPEFRFIVFEEEVWGQTRTPSDPKFSNAAASWYFEPIQAYRAWDITMGSPDVTVAVLDGFFDLSHPEFRGKIVHPFNVVRNSTNLAPFSGMLFADTSHGSNVASIALARADNGLGLCGIAPECKLMPVGIFLDQLFPSPNGPRVTSGSILVAYGMLYAIYRGADVINLSVSTPSPLGDLHPEDQIDIIRRMPKDLERVWDHIYSIAERRGVIIVTAAGNENAIAGFDSSKRNNTTIRVSALDANLERAYFSNYGYADDGQNGAKDYSSVSAPGVLMYGAGQGGFCVMQGTSQAAPIVTGAVALMKSIDRSITAPEAIHILQETGQPVGKGCGPLIQIYDALKRVKGKILNFDEVQKDPSSIIGLWESTTGLVNNRTKAPIKYYFRFTSTSGGTSIIKDSGDGQVYTSPIALSITKQQITFNHTADPKSPSGPKWSRYTFTGKPGRGGELECHGVNIVKPENNYDFRLRRISD